MRRMDRDSLTAATQRVFVSAPGGENYEAFVSGRLVYHRFVLEKM